MNIYVSWCYTSTAEEAEGSRQEWYKKVEKSKVDEDKALKEALQREQCLPEYTEFCKAIEGRKVDQAGDAVTENLLAIRFAVPKLGEIQSFKLATRLPKDKKLPVAIAARNWLLNAFAGEWTGNLRRIEPFRVTFIGLPGLKTFLERWATACAVHDQPLPVDLWTLTPQFELPTDVSLRNLLLACAKTQDDFDESEKYAALVRGWFTSGASAERDSAVLLAAAFKLGLKGA